MAFKQIRESISQTKLAVELAQYKALSVLMETSEYQKIEDEVEKSLNTPTPGTLKELAKNKNWMVRLALAANLKITSDMPEELLKEAKEVAEKLLHDHVWAVRVALAQNSDIEPNFFRSLAEKLKKDKDWRVVILGLGLNDNTPEETNQWLEENKKELLGRLKLIADFMSLLK